MSAMSSQQDELDQLRKRARRRLVGAIVMSLIAGGVMLRVLDSKPQHEMRPETVDIVSNLPGQQPAKPASEAAATTAPAEGASTSTPAASTPPADAKATAPAGAAQTAAPAAATPSAETTPAAVAPPQAPRDLA